MNARSNSVKLVVTFDPREDGGLRACSDDLPGFVLSHSNAREVLADVKPALEIILSAMFNSKVTVSDLVSVREYRENDGRVDQLESANIFHREYVGLVRVE